MTKIAVPIKIGHSPYIRGETEHGRKSASAEDVRDVAKESSARQGMTEFEARALETAPRRAESAKDVHYKLILARQVKQLVAQFMSKLKAT